MKPNEREQSFPSMQFVILLYAAGAALGLVFAFDSTLDSMQTTTCLVISWLLALVALAMSVLWEVQDEAEDA